MTKKKVLVIDDDADVVAVFRTLLEDNGYQVTTAADGDQGMQQILAERPDLITLDITMPNTSGVRVYRNLKENEALKSIPVVIVSGVQHEFKKFISTRKQVPAPEGYLEKPVGVEDVLKEVRRLIG